MKTNILYSNYCLGTNKTVIDAERYEITREKYVAIYREGKRLEHGFDWDWDRKRIVVKTGGWRFIVDWE